MVWDRLPRVALPRPANLQIATPSNLVNEGENKRRTSTAVLSACTAPPQRPPHHCGDTPGQEASKPGDTTFHSARGRPKSSPLSRGHVAVWCRAVTARVLGARDDARIAVVVAQVPRRTRLDQFAAGIGLPAGHPSPPCPLGGWGSLPLGAAPFTSQPRLSCPAPQLRTAGGETATSSIATSGPGPGSTSTRSVTRASRPSASTTHPRARGSGPGACIPPGFAAHVQVAAAAGRRVGKSGHASRGR